MPQTRPSKTQMASIAEFNRLRDPIGHRRPLIRAPRNCRFDLAPTGHVGFRRATRGWAIVTERAGREKCWRNGDKVATSTEGKALSGAGFVESKGSKAEGGCRARGI